MRIIIRNLQAMSKQNELTVEAYINAVDSQRQADFRTLFELIQANVPKDFQTVIQYKMIAWVVPFSIYPQGYHCQPNLQLPFANLAAQKSHLAIYHMGLYANAQLMDWFVTEHSKRSSKKLDIGKSCIRYKKIEDVPLDLIAELFQKIDANAWVKLYTQAFLKSKA